MAPFTHTGVDYFGPIEVAVGRRREKRWVALFTCMTTRAVYLELAYSASGESCVAAIESLVARRGMPMNFYSDNGTCFVAAAKTYVGPFGRRPKWHFIPPKAPHMGGAWERLVGVVKAALAAMEMARVPTEQTLRRCLCMAERLVNSRPLTEIPVDPDEEECLTPNHFIFGTSNGIKLDLELEEFDESTAVQEWDKIVNGFWKRWLSEYLPTISLRAKWSKRTKAVAVDDVVFMCDDEDHRRGWSRAKVTHIKLDPESEQVRSVIVQTADGKRYTRPACKIAPIIRSTTQNKE